MSFLLKKFIAFWFMPVPLCLTLLAIGWWLTRSGRKSRPGRIFLGAGLLLFAAFASKPVSTWLVESLESRYRPIPEIVPGSPLPDGLAACKSVVVLGSGNGNTPGMAAVDMLSQSGLERIAEAIRLLRVMPQAGLIVSGPPEGPGTPSHASVLARAAESFGVAADRIRLIDTARDTYEESRAVRALVGANRVALVTSAAHMPRAAALFRSAGVSFVACPTDYSVRPGGPFQASNWTWDEDSLNRSTWAVHEWLGLLFERLRGQI